MKQNLKKFFGKVVMFMFATAMMVSVAWLSEEASVVYATEETYYITEAQTGLIITDDMTAPKPNTEGKETYIFAGYYEDATCKIPVTESTDATVYKKFVPAEIMSVKAQVTKGTKEDSAKTNMRLVATVDGLNYKEVGFDVYFNGSTTPVNAKTTTVYEKIVAAEKGNEFGYRPEAFSVDAEYFTTVNLVNIANKNFDKTFFIKPYWKTLDGTKVYGMSRMVRVADSYNKIVNIPVRLYTDTTVNAGAFDLTYDTDILTYREYDNGDVFESVTAVNDATSAKVTVTTPAEMPSANGMVVNLRFQVKEGQTMPSYEVFDVTGDFGAAIASIEYRSFEVSYNGVADTSWYDGYEDKTKFVISTPAAFYGFAKIVNDTSGIYKDEQFSGDTILLCADITINTGNPSKDAWATNEPSHKWVPIGKSVAFAGVFNGCGSTINGIYVNDGGTATNYVGLFGTINSNAQIRNFRLENSFFKNTATSALGWGSIVGRCSGDALIQDVYSDAVLFCSGRQIGGILGRKETASTEVTINNCWFAGQITLNGDGNCARAAGGIAGASAAGTVTIDNALNTGSIITNRTGISTNQQALGGIFGIDWGASTVTITNSLNAGTITVNVNEENATKDIGAIVGRIGVKDSVFTVSSTYTTDESWSAVGSKNGGNKVSQVSVTAKEESEITGHKSYVAISEFDFATSSNKDGVWVVRDGVPGLRLLEDNWIDVAWYYDNTTNEADTFEIGTVQELYGFSALSQDFDFEGDTVKLTKNITANVGKAASWAEETTIPARQWKPIGNSENSFKGTFDGQKHFIKGIYVNAETQHVGLFGYAEGATIQDLQLSNSYIHTTVDRIGGIAGYYTGSMYRVYCDAIVVSTRSSASDCGGLIGYYEKIANKDEISECWFAGTAEGYTRTGGIVGYLRNGRKEISDTLVTGTVKTTADIRNGQIGGLVGSINNYAGAVLEITSSLGAGTMQDSYTGTSSHQTGGIVGYKQANATVTVNNVYTTFSKGLGTQNNDSGTSSVEADYIKVSSVNDIKGSTVYTNDVMNLGCYMYDSTWVARTTDIPVPRCFVGTVVDEADIVEDTTAHTAWYDANPDATEFEIKTENDLLGFAEIVNAGEKFSGKIVKLAKDMDLNRGWKAPKTVDEESVEPSVEWSPIGNNAKVDNVNNRFQGTFDGQGHSVSGIYYNTVDKKSNIGLFGYIDNNAIIKNLQLTNSYFKGTHVEPTGWGSIAGQSDNAMFINVYSDAVMSYMGRQIGGIVGRAAGSVTIERCWFDGEINASHHKKDSVDAEAIGAGGIVGATVTPTGFSDPILNITDCLNTGNIKSTATHSTNQNTAMAIGGIFGTDWNKGSVNISGCLNKGTITTVLHQGVGAIVGRAQVSGSVFEITGCYALNTSIKDQTFEDIGYINTSNNPSITPSTQAARCPAKEIAQLVGESIYAEGGLDLNYATWIARTNDVPVPRYFVGSIVDEKETIQNTTGKVYADTTWYTQNTNANAYSIETAHELAGLASLVNEGVTFDGRTINLVKDIDFNEGWTAPATIAQEVVAPINTWMPIGNSSSVSFQGTLDGNGNTIRGIYVDEDVETTYTGLFGYTKTCVVKNLRLENSYFSTANPYMGSIIGYGNGTLTNVYSDAIMHSTNIEVGGLVGRGVKEGNGDIKLLNINGSWFDGGIRVELSSTSAANAYVGGLVGYAFTSDTIINTCLYTGEISLVYTSATANPNTRSGGLIGAENSTNAYASISNTVSAGTITGIMEGTATAINNLCTTIGQVRSTSTVCSNVYDMSVVTKVIGGNSSTSSAKCGGTTENVDTVKNNINQTYYKEDIFGLGAQLLTSLDFVQDADEAIWAARRGQILAPAGLVAESEKLNVIFDKADTDIADGATGDSAEDPYIIDSVEELYGFAILSRTESFANKYIKLGRDLDLNPGESAEDWAEGTVASLPWYSIGVAEDGLRFAGHFDGNGKTISGLFMKDDSSYLGLFAATETGSTISNLRLTNSYINYTGNGNAYTGSVVGDLRGDMTEVYSDAIVNSSGTQTGGIIGQVNEVSDDATYAVDITNCWYDGQLTSSKTYAGGLFASTAKGTVNVDNCLNTATITTTATASNINNAVAGICAQVSGASILTITDTISAGKITDANHGKNVKSVVAYIPNGSVRFEDVFATKSSYARMYPSKGGTGSYTGTILRTQEADRFIGYCVEEIIEKEGEVSTRSYPALEFGENEWTIRMSDVPVPTCFSDLVTPVTSVESDAQIGLDYLNTTLNTTLTLADAVDMGEGNYVFKVTADDTVYASYKSTLEGRGFGAPVVENIADTVHSVSYKKVNPDWVVTLTYVETTDSLTISINTNINSLSDKLVSTGDEIAYATGDVKLTMLQMYEDIDVLDENGQVIGSTQLEDIYADLHKLEYSYNANSYWYGNSFVFQVSENHFVIIDGGAKEEYDDLIGFLQTAVGKNSEGEQQPVYIDAWIISHQHADHADVLKAVADNPILAKGIYVDAFYLSEPNAKTLTDNSLYDDAEKQYYAMTLFIKSESGEQADVYRMHTGQRYNFNGLVMDVIQTQDQIDYSDYADYNATTQSKRDFNTSSTITLFSTETQKVLTGGDANYVNMGYVMKAYDTDSTDGNKYTPTALLQNIDVFVSFHHGKNMSMQLSKKDTSFVDYLTYGEHKFDYILYPCSLIYGDYCDPAFAFPNAEEVNEELNKRVINPDNIKHFGKGNVEITLQGTTTE